MAPRESLNILYVGNLPPFPGGAAISCGQILAGLATRGHGVRALAPITAATLAHAGPPGLKHVQTIRYLVPHFYVGPHVPPSDEYRRVERAELQALLPPLLEQDPPDVILLGRESFAQDVPEIVGRRVPLVIMVRGGTVLGILHGFYPQPLAGHMLQQFRKVSLLVTPARHVTESLRRLGVPNVRTILNAVDVHAFAPGPKDAALLNALRIQSADVVVVHASNMKPIKRPLDVVHSAARALPQDPRLVYVIVGDGALRRDLEDAAREADVAERFRFTGWVPYERMPDYMRLADIVAVPSEFEGQARVYLEAQACGRVVVASNIAGAREVIADGASGFLFEMGNPADLASKTLLAAADPGLSRRIGEQARRQVQATHTIDEAVRAYETTLLEVTGDARRRPPLAVE